MELSNLPTEIETLLTNLFANSYCACHIINPHKTRILMWKKIENNKEIYHLRIGIQKFISQEQTDRNGEIYWRYFAYEPKHQASQPVSQKEEVKPEVQTEPDPITKFNQRQEKAKSYDKSNSEPAVNSQSS